MIKTWKNCSLLLAGLFTIATLFAACSSDDDDNNGGNNGDDDGDNTEEPTDKYPSGAIVWSEDTTVILTGHYIVPEGKSLYIEPGATIIADNTDLKPEIVVLGNLYSMGTAEKPVVFTVENSSKSDRFSRNWGGIICGMKSEEVYLSYTTMEYCGAQTTEESESYKHQLFKTETGEGVPALHFCNPDGKLVVDHCTFFNNAEDHMYITGGNSIITYNKFISNGFDGGEAINYKSECLADIAYNLIYDANTNGFKLSNAGFVNMQSHLVCYNNTIVNTGWRRPKVKGGSIWLETGILVELYNNLVYDCRWGLKRSTSEGEDAASVLTPNYYFASTQKGVDQMEADEENGIINGAADIISKTPGDKDPLFVNYTQQANVNINVSSNEGDVPQTWNSNWDFHLQAQSPAIAGGTTNFTRHFKSGIELKGLDGIFENNVFISPSPAIYFGAYGSK